MKDKICTISIYTLQDTTTKPTQIKIRILTILFKEQLLTKIRENKKTQTRRLK